MMMSTMTCPEREKVKQIFGSLDVDDRSETSNLRYGHVIVWVAFIKDLFLMILWLVRVKICRWRLTSMWRLLSARMCYLVPISFTRRGS